MAGPRFWTEDRRLDVARRSRMGFTYAEISAYLGTTVQAIQRMNARHKLISKEERNKLQSESMTGRKLSPKEVAQRRRVMKEAWANPEIRAQRLEKRREICQRPEIKAQIEAARKAAARKRRGGYDLPDEATAAIFRFLTQSKKIPAAEAGRMLNLPHYPATTERRA